MKRTLLVLGASGLTGYKTMQLAKKRFDTHGTYNLRKTENESLIKLDVTRGDEMKKVVHEIKPDIIVNTVALHNVDYCETHEDEAYNVNSRVVGNLAEICNNLGVRLIHISTDFVFDGTVGNYSESDKPNPLNVYARSKLEGEIHASKCSSFCILRPSVVYGWTLTEKQATTASSSGKPQNFALWALSKMKKNEEMKIVDDQYTSPTLADVLASVSLRLATSDMNEIFHVSGTNSISRYEFTRKLAVMMGYPSSNIMPISSKTFSQVAKRPANSSLNCAKVQEALNYRLLNVDESLAVMRSQIEVEAPDILGI